jgi:hypothetical protein
MVCSPPLPYIHTFYIIPLIDSLGFTEAHSKTISLAYRYVSETEPEPEASLTIFGLCCYPVCYYTQLPHCAARLTWMTTALITTRAV